MAPTPSSDIPLMSGTSGLSASFDKLWTALGGKELEATHVLKPEALQPFPPPLGFNSFQHDLVCNVGYFDPKEVSAEIDGIMVHTNVQSFILSLVCFIRVHDLLIPAALDAIRDNLAACLRSSAADWYIRARTQRKLEGKNLFRLISMLQERYGALTQKETMKVPQCLTRREQPLRQRNPQCPVQHAETAAIQCNSPSKAKAQAVNDEFGSLQSKPAMDPMQPSEAAPELHRDLTGSKYNETRLSAVLDDWGISARKSEDAITVRQPIPLPGSSSPAPKEVDTATAATPAAAVDPVVGFLAVSLSEQLPSPSNNAVKAHQKPAESDEKPTSPLSNADRMKLVTSDWMLLPASTANANDIRKGWAEVGVDSVACGEEGVLGEWEVV